ncbi:type II toxin-antitoxin system HipA family toxin [Sphingomonas sp. DT-207]|uniref:type II toxin-antitoxin system HipA family toxin n=1 Tax=Sphingomonas sp. DT-207 TaxID=3396167 RepID=UPI003F1CB47A
MPKRRSSTLAVLLNGRLLGRLHRAANGAVDFRYEQAWLDWEFAIPASLSLPLGDQRYTGAQVTAVFDNLLPDNDDIRRRIAERIGADGIDAYSLLSVVGRDCVGALQFLEEGQTPTPVGQIEAVPASDDDIAQIIANLAKAPLGLEPDDTFRISIAGAQEKTALLWWEDKWQKPLGTTPTTHIFKPQIGQLPNGIDLSNSVENEHFCLTLMGNLGLPVAPTRIERFGGRPVLIVERFDRQHGRGGRLLRRPQEDICQALSVPPTRKYEDHGGPGVVEIMRLLAASDTPDVDRRHFMKTMIAFWMIGATDGHAKNFSIFLAPGGRFNATPLYDVLSVEPSLAAHQVNRTQVRLAMAIGDRRRYRVFDIFPRHFLQSAALNHYDEREILAIFDELQAEGEAALERAAAAMPAGTPDAVIGPIAQAFRHRLKAIELL